MARSGPVLLAAAAAMAVACTYTFEVPETAQIACSEGGAPCPEGWHCEVAQGRCAINGSVVEVPEVRVQPSTPIATAENGGAASLAVTLGATPTAPVRVPVVSTKPSEATVFPPELTFNDSNWNQAQTVTIQGVRDQVVDGDQPYEVVVGPPASNDTRFSSLAEIRIAATNADSDTARILASPTSITTSESDTPSTPTPFQVTLSSRPSGVVIVPVASSDTGEATVSPATVAFDAGTWNVPQTVLAVGVDDPFPIADGRHPYRIDLGAATSTDPHFQGATGSVDGHNVDNDSPGVRVQPSTGSRTYEPNSYAYIYVSLFTQPTSDVTIAFTSLTTDQVTVDPSTQVLTFDAGNWDYGQYMIVRPVDDPYDEQPEEVDWTVQSSNAVSTDPNYSGMVVDDITGKNVDEEESLLLFDDSTYNYFSLSEYADPPKQIRVKLSSKPHGAITIRPASANTGKLTVTPSQMTLDESSWTAGAVMTVTPLDNNAREYDPQVDITFSVTAALPSQDPGYHNLSVPPLHVTLQDDERIIFTLSTPQDGDLTEPFGGSYFIMDSLCTSDPGQAQLFNYSLAMLAVDNPGFSFFRIASASPNLGDGQIGWVLAMGRNYLSETRNGPVIGRANGKNLLDFPLARALTTAGDVWTGLEADWTTSGVNCSAWTDNGSGSSGRFGTSGSTTTTALAGGAAACDGARRILCVEQY
jgi:hypothetical protein